jgi:flagellar motor switch protein FliN/FliY
MSNQEEKPTMEEVETPEAAQEQSQEALEAGEATGEENPDISKLELEHFDSPGGNGGEPDLRRMELLMDILLPVSIELGRTKMYVKDILELERGSIIELDKMAGEPVDLYINNKKMAEGEVVVVDKHFGIRITQLIDPADRIKNLGKGY